MDAVAAGISADRMEDAAMQYLYLGDSVGGRAEGAEFYDEDGRIN